MKIKNSNELLEMSISQDKAITQCITFGSIFIEHFKKIIAKPNIKIVNAWANHMQKALDNVKDFRFKHNNKRIFIDQLIDWFFTKGSSIEDLFDNVDDQEKYNNFLNEIIKSLNVKDALIKSNLVDAIYLTNK